MSRPKQQATCHPERPHYARGFCLNCYQQVRYYDNFSSTSARFEVEHLPGQALRLFKQFGYLESDWREMIAGGCPICGKHATRWVVDAPEEKVKGVVCGDCWKVVEVLRKAPPGVWEWVRG